MKLAATVMAVLLLAPAARAQDSTSAAAWKYDSSVILALSQSAYSSNWSGGDLGSIVWAISTDSKAERDFGPLVWTNHLAVAYGQTARQKRDPADAGRLIWDQPEKSSDKIEFESIGRWQVHPVFNPYASLRLDTQFLDQSNPLGDLDFNPIKLKEAVGVSAILHKTEDSEVISRLGFGLRQTFGRSLVADPVVRTESFTSNDGGLEWQTSVTRPLLEKKVVWKSEVLAFQPLFYSKSGALEDYDARVRAGDATRPAEPTAEAVADFWKAIDVRFENSFTASITKSLGVELNLALVYDKFDTAANVDEKLALDALVPEVTRNVRKAGQFRQTLALILSYKLF